MSILDILTEVNADSGKIYKKETIEKYKDNELLVDVFKCISPFRILRESTH